MSRPHEHDSSEAPVRGGLTRMSDEGAAIAPEQRGQLGAATEQQQQWKNAQKQRKMYAIERQEIERAWQKVRAKGGIGGVDGESIKSFGERLDKNLYKLWNRMSSGSYHPKAVMRVEIPKGEGKTRPLGIPTITDRIAQEVVKARLEPIVERFFHRDSYGYRPNKSAREAVGTCRERCWRYNWVLDVDIQKFFDTIDHELMMKAVKKHCPEKWMVLYIKRWLGSPVQHRDGTMEESRRGTPQGGVISPLLANLYLHYAFDAWMGRTFPAVEFERYADDIVIHCKSQEQSAQIRQALSQRLAECGLTLHPEKTTVVYCKDGNRRGLYPTKKFTFLGYTFQPREAQNRQTKERFIRFLPAVGSKAGKLFRTRLKATRLFQMHHLTVEELAHQLNPRVWGWYEYFSCYYKSALSHMSYWLDGCIIRWLRTKFQLNWKMATAFLHRLQRREPLRFAHWLYRFPGRAV